MFGSQPELKCPKKIVPRWNSGKPNYVKLDTGFVKISKVSRPNRRLKISQPANFVKSTDGLVMLTQIESKQKRSKVNHTNPTPELHPALRTSCASRSKVTGSGTEVSLDDKTCIKVKEEGIDHDQQLESVHYNPVKVIKEENEEGSEPKMYLKDVKLEEIGEELKPVKQEMSIEVPVEFAAVKEEK